MKNLLAVLLTLVFSIGLLWSVDYVRKPNYELFQRQTVRVEFINVESSKRAVLCSGVYLGGRRILTAGHCAKLVEDPDSHLAAYIRPFNSKQRIYAEFVRVEKRRNERGMPISDIGLLRLDRPLRGVHAASVSCRVPKLGETLYAVGMPHGLPWTITKGTVTTRVPRIPENAGRWLQLDMTIIGGNSGGPVFDRDGNVVGIVSHTLTKALGAPTGHAYAVSSKILCEFLSETTLPEVSDV